MAMTPAITIVGSVNVDLVVVVDGLPGAGETVVGPDLVQHGGGKGANVAVACARLGASTAFVGAVGDDDFGVQARHGLEHEGIDLSELEILDGVSTGVAMIAVDPRGENQIIVALGANHALRPEQVEAALKRRIEGCSCVVVGSEIPDDCVVTAVRCAREAGVPCVLVPAPARPSLVDAMAHGPVVTPNQGEAEVLTRSLGADWDGDEQLAPALCKAAGVPVVMTRGGRGAVVAEPGKLPVAVATTSVDVVDTTGAGDAFAGALAVRLAAGADLEAAAGYAVVAAALSVTHAGARAGMPTSRAVIAAMP